MKQMEKYIKEIQKIKVYLQVHRNHLDIIERLFYSYFSSIISTEPSNLNEQANDWRIDTRVASKSLQTINERFMRMWR